MQKPYKQAFDFEQICRLAHVKHPNTIFSMANCNGRFNKPALAANTLSSEIQLATIESGSCGLLCKQKLRFKLFVRSCIQIVTQLQQAKREILYDDFKT